MLDAQTPDSAPYDATGGLGELALIAVLHAVIDNADNDLFAVEPALTVLLSS